MKEKAECTQLLIFRSQTAEISRDSCLHGLCRLRGFISVFPGSPHGVGQWLRSSVAIPHLLKTDKDWFCLHCLICDGTQTNVFCSLHTVHVLNTETSNNQYCLNSLALMDSISLESELVLMDLFLFFKCNFSPKSLD